MKPEAPPANVWKSNMADNTGSNDNNNHVTQPKSADHVMATTPRGDSPDLPPPPSCDDNDIVIMNNNSPLPPPPTDSFFPNASSISPKSLPFALNNDPTGVNHSAADVENEILYQNQQEAFASLQMPPPNAYKHSISMPGPQTNRYEKNNDLNMDNGNR